MTAPNRNTLWARTVVAELAAQGVTAAVVSPGSRSTPLTAALAEHSEMDVYSVLDERSAAFFALGRGKRTGEPTALVCTSGTAAANYHPAIVEASQARVPLLALTADRPPELTDSGANQTIDQEKLYGDAVRFYRDMPEPEAEARKLRMVRTTAARAVTAATGTNPGPVHLNFRFRKPLEPTEVPGDVPDSFTETAPLAAEGRDGPYVTVSAGANELPAERADSLADRIARADRGLVVAGPDDHGLGVESLLDLAEATGFPVLADPLSDLRFGRHCEDVLVCGGYDSYLDADAVAEWSDPDAVIRFGGSPTSKVLRHYLRDADCEQFVVDPAGGWREAEFTATDLLVADPDRTALALAGRLDASDSHRSSERKQWRDRFAAAERVHWQTVAEGRDEQFFEGAVLATVFEDAPDPATLLVSNSMPVRDADRFARPRTADLTVLGNRGASGIDGVTSTALGAGSATTEPLVAVLGDVAYYHDMNGLLSVARCGVDATLVVVNNDGGGIFHLLPIEDFDPPFTEQFKTPHGLDFEPTGDLYGFDFERVHDADAFRTAYRESLASDGTQVIEVRIDGEASHRFRERLHERVRDRIE